MSIMRTALPLTVFAPGVATGVLLASRANCPFIPFIKPFTKFFQASLANGL
ncbi:hypothetical protein [Pseudomonas kitaguniensis]|uniref:hypothetical protein n=1 Tax=Pseudomonas kitaguniensis TaxID=2607908 RepID=UPI001561F1E9|nr:hypothetical protein [Pseudomonas kitaguniensis]